MPMLDYADAEISKICPIDGISEGVPDDKSTWVIHFSENATDDQKKAAMDFLASFTWNNETCENERKSHRNGRLRFDLLYRKAFQDYREQHPHSNFSEFLDYLETLAVPE